VHGQCVIPNDLEVMIPPPASLPIELQAMISEISLSSDPTMSHVEIASVASEHLVTTPQSEAAALPSDLQVIISETEPTTLPLPSPAAQPDQTELEQLRNQLAEALAERDTFMHKLESSDHSNVQVCFVAWFRLTMSGLCYNFYGTSDAGEHGFHSCRNGLYKYNASSSGKYDDHYPCSVVTWFAKNTHISVCPCVYVCEWFAFEC
jgi:hypothetical protein